MNRDRAPPPPPPPPGQQRPQQFQGPPPQQLNPQQHFQGPPQQFRGPILHQHEGPRYPADVHINGVATIHRLIPAKQKTEKDFRKELTEYEVYRISPSKVSGSDKKDKKDEKDKKTSESKGSWTEALIVQQFFDKKDIDATIKRLDATDSATKKMKELGPNQSAQISYILEKKFSQDRDPQFEWIVAQLEKDFHAADKNGKKLTRSITVYLKHWPKAEVDCMDLVQRRKMQERQQLDYQRMMHQQQQQAQQQAQQQHQQMRMQQAQQEHAERMNPPRIKGPGGPRMPGGGGGSSPAGIRIVESDSDSKSSGSNSDTNSESESDSETNPSSINSSRSGRRRKDKQYYGRGNARGGRSRSRSRNYNKDYIIAAPLRRADSRMRRMPRVPDSPRDARDRSRSRPGLARRTTYNGRPSVEVHERTSPNFFDVPHAPLMQHRPVSIHQQHAQSVSPNAMTEAIFKGIEIGMKARQANVNVHDDALTPLRPAFQRNQTMPRPPVAHSLAENLDYRTRQYEAEAEAFQRRDDEMAARVRDLRMRDSRSPFRNLRDSARTVPRIFDGADLYDPYPAAPLSPSISSRSSGGSYSSREERDPYSARGREYGFGRSAGSQFDSDREEYDFIGRDEANPFRPQRQPLSRAGSRPPSAIRRASFMAPYPHDRRY